MHIYLHLEDAVALAHAGLLGGAVGQHCADVLQGRVELAVDAAQLAALAHLPADVEPEAGLGLVDGDAARALRRRGLGRLEVLLLLLSGAGWPEATEPPVVPGVPDHRRHRRVHYNHSAHVRVALAQLARQLARARTHIHTRGTTISRRLAAAWLALSPHLAVPVFLSLSLSLSVQAARLAHNTALLQAAVAAAAAAFVPPPVSALLVAGATLSRAHCSFLIPTTHRRHRRSRLVTSRAAARYLSTPTPTAYAYRSTDNAHFIFRQLSPPVPWQQLFPANLRCRLLLFWSTCPAHLDSGPFKTEHYLDFLNAKFQGQPSAGARATATSPGDTRKWRV